MIPVTEIPEDLSEIIGHGELRIKELRKKAKTARKEIIFHFSLFIFHF